MSGAAVPGADGDPPEDDRSEDDKAKDLWVFETFGVDPNTYPRKRARPPASDTVTSVNRDEAPAALRRDEPADAQPPPDVPGSGPGDGSSPGPLAAVFRQVFGHVDPDAWAAKGAVAGGLSGAAAGGLAGGAVEGTAGALAGTAIEPGGGTLVGGVAGAADGVVRGAAVGGVAGAVILGIAAKLAGVLVNTMEGSGEADDGATPEAAETRPTFIPDEITSKLPPDWGQGRPTNSPGGWRWIDRRRGDGVRVDPANPQASNSTQQVEHVVVNSGGRIIGRDGWPIEGSIAQNYERAHIPLSEYRKWRTWNQP